MYSRIPFDLQTTLRGGVVPISQPVRQAQRGHLGSSREAVELSSCGPDGHSELTAEAALTPGTSLPEPLSQAYWAAASFHRADWSRAGALAPLLSIMTSPACLSALAWDPRGAAELSSKLTPPRAA